MIGQIELYDVEDLDAAQEDLVKDRQHWIDMANAQNRWMVEHGGGCKDIEVRILRPRDNSLDNSPGFIVVHLHVDLACNN